jgi:hypothetical protein
MFPYQLRVPASLEIEQMIGHIAKECWQVVQHRFSVNGNDEIRSKFNEETFHAFSLYLKKYDLCGSSDICQDEMRFMSSDHDPSVDTKIYHLQLPVRLDLFLELFASLLLNSLPKLDLISKQKVHDDLKFVLRSVLNRYLSINLRCGKTQICQYSKLTDIS